jgi:hypothetical protein
VGTSHYYSVGGSINDNHQKTKWQPINPQTGEKKGIQFRLWYFSVTVLYSHCNVQV